MADDHPSVAYCKRDLETFRTRLQGLKSGRLKFGKSVDGVTWTDTTDEDIAFAESKIAELETSILGYNAKPPKPKPE